jgi:hypothetical protein
MIDGMSTGDIVAAIYRNQMVVAVFGLMLANVVAGISYAIYDKDFRLAQVGDWLYTRAVPYVGGAGAVQLVLLTVPAQWSGMSTGLSTVVWGFVILSLLGRILFYARAIGIPIPTFLTDKNLPETKAVP